MAYNTPQPSTGTNYFNPAGADFVLESFARLQVRSSSLTREHTWNAYMSAQLLLAEWNIRPSWPNLWKVELFSVPLVQGVPTYAVPSNVISVLDVFLREYQNGNPIDLTNAFSTTQGSASVTITLDDNGLVVGNPIIVVCPVAIGGIILFGQYTVASIIDPNDFTINAAAEAASTVAYGGTVPSFSTTFGSPTVTAVLPDNGYGAGNAFSVQIPTLVGGLTLSGVYTIASIIDENTFTFNANVAATSTATVYENNGSAQIETQPSNSTLADFVVTPISRTEYADQPNKLIQARPTTYWFDRLINPQITTWPVADNDGLYTLYYYAVTQLFDFSLQAGTTTDLPVRFYEAFAAGLTEKLAWKYPPPPASGITMALIKARADEAWDWASRQDVEQQTPMFITPGMLSYYRQ